MRFLLSVIILLASLSSHADEFNSCELAVLQSSNIPLVNEVPREPRDAKALADVLKIAGDRRYELITGAQNWRQLYEPFFGKRPRGIDAIRKQIQTDGLNVVVAKAKPRLRRDGEKDRLLYGANVVYLSSRSHPERPEYVPGVLLTPSPADDDLRMLNAYRGDINLNLGWGWLHPLLYDKLTENRVVNAIWPGAMATHESYEDLLNKNILSEEFESRRLEIASSLLNKNRVSKADVTERIATLISDLFSAAERQFPKGAFVKNYFEMASGDSGKLITTNKGNPSAIAEEFVNRFLAFRGSAASFLDPKLRRFMLAETDGMGAFFVYRLLADPNPIIFQERLEIAKTPLGELMEFRVDFLDCEPVNSFPRYTDEYLGQDLQIAQLVIKEFCKRAPWQFQYISGGADVVKLKDGTWKIIELNAGSNSGSLDPLFYTIPYHQLISRLTGKRTEFLSQLDSIFEAGPSAQNKYLKSLRRIRQGWWKESMEELSRYEVAVYFRNRYLKEFDFNPTARHAQNLRDKFMTAIRDIGRHSDIQFVKDGFDSYVTSRLGRR